MELKHFLIGIAVFVLLGLGLFYLGSLLTVLDGDLKRTDAPPPPIAEIFNSVEDLKSQVEEQTQQQQDVLDRIR